MAVISDRQSDVVSFPIKPDLQRIRLSLQTLPRYLAQLEALALELALFYFAIGVSFPLSALY